MNENIKLYVNTIKYLKPSQIYYRINNRVKRELYKKNILKIQAPRSLNVKRKNEYLIHSMDYDPAYLKRFDEKDIFNNEFNFININKKVDLSTAWYDPEIQQLWRYNLHYFEYLYKLAFEYEKSSDNDYYDKYKEMITNWIENNHFAYGDGWHPYTISLRLTNWLVTSEVFNDELERDSAFESLLNESAYVQYRFLLQNLEKDVLGNHYFENIKAIILGSIYFQENDVQEKFEKELLVQLKEQVLEDGMHFELSPMYHKIILEDLIKITYWLKDSDTYKKLTNYIQSMADTLYSFENNFGKTPAFNDSAKGISKDQECLLNTCELHFGIKPNQKYIFGKSGFYIFEDQNKKVIFDNGEICPSYLPAHGQCDALSYELSWNGSPFIVNSGTYKYENGPWRDYFRSTSTHNTVMINSHEQSQAWGSFRVAKRIHGLKRKQFLHNDISFFAGEYLNYLGEKHKRFIGNISGDLIIVLDFTKAEAESESYIHFKPETELDIYTSGVDISTKNKKASLQAFGTERIEKKQGWYSEQFNFKEENDHLVLTKSKQNNFFGYLINLNKTATDLKLSDGNILITNQEMSRSIRLEELEKLL
ncbi:heparinase II/III family protein [Alkalicoccus saliphilus]|uniref:Uncharacterized protein n=1 Tax=Alkalicoccus saliphilus TaxID=200989 RepID=A0A2T4U3D3_9BACI|nr:alginate lyase family protein [Alkalicoccus saliphilus]PTL37910.1 hypothetical protein C6Y45_14000 [Alkalicoccus saliphilus]